MNKQARYAVFDIDNCLANDMHRRHLINRDKEGDERWNAYHEAAHLDAPSKAAITLIEMWIRNGVDIVYCTGRPEQFRRMTAHWLHKNVGNHTFTLLMRKDGNHEPAYKIKVGMLAAVGLTPENVEICYDDNMAVLASYQVAGYQAERLAIDADIDEQRPAAEPVPPPRRAADILMGMAATYRERNRLYADNYKQMGPIMNALFPNGVQLKTAHDHNVWAMIVAVVTKLGRFANSGMRHKDSVHDIGVYAAMIEELLNLEA